MAVTTPLDTQLTEAPTSARPPEGAPSPPEVAIQLAGGFVASQAVYALSKLGLADALADGPHPVGTVATTAGTDPELTYRLLRTLGAFGVVDETSPGSFRLTPVGQLFRNEPGSLADLTMMWMETHYKWFAGLTGTVVGGDTAFDRIEGTTFWGWLEENDDENELFSRAMASIGAQTEQAAVAAYDFSRFRTIVDVAGAHGSLLTAALLSNPAANGVLFDLPHVTETAGPVLAERGVTDRVQVVSGDFFHSVPHGADAYLLRFILHDWGEEEAVRILSNIREAIPAHGELLIIENVVPEGNTPHLGKLLDLIMMTIVSGTERTRGEYDDLCSQSGFSLDAIIPTAAPTSILVARPV